MAKKRFWYDFEDCTGAKMIDLKNDKEYPLETIGDFRDIEDLLNNFADENEQLKSENQELKQLLKSYKQSNEDYKYQIHKAVTEKLTMLELADNCGVDVE